MTLRQIPASLAIAAAALATAACVMPDQLAKIEKDVADLQNQMRRVEREQSEATTQLRTIKEQTAAASANPSREDVADMGARIDQVERETSVSGERITDLNRRIDGLSQELQQALELARRAGEGSPPAPRPGTSTTPPLDGGGADAPAPDERQQGDALPDPEALYNTAYADFSKGNFALAIAGFEEYYERYPESAQADNALYWIGECHFSQGNFSEAIASFDRLLDLYPASDKAAASNLKKALAFLEQNQVGQAIVQLRFVVSTYPGTDEARIARDKLTSLGAP